MKQTIKHIFIAAGAFLFFTSNAIAQFVSGSTGADGALNVTSDTTLALPASGVFNYTTVNVASGATLTFTPNTANTPVRILATGDVVINGTISVSGKDGANGIIGLGNFGFGAAGPGGFSGGFNGAFGSSAFGTYGLGRDGGDGSFGGAGGRYPTTNYEHLTLLPGGSGGGGGRGGAITSVAPGGSSGGAGGGGAGALLVASSTKIVLNGLVKADGGKGGNGIDKSSGGGGGSGGGIRMVASRIEGAGTLSAAGGAGGVRGSAGTSGSDNANGVVGGVGLIRMEALTLTFTGTASPAASITTPFTAIPSQLPTIAITSVGGQPVPANPSGTFNSIDITLPPGTTNPVSISGVTTNIPPNKQVQVVAKDSKGGKGTGFPQTTGTQASSTFTTSLTLSSGVSIIEASISAFTVTASLAPFMPLVGGEPVTEIKVASALGSGPTWTLVTPSGREVPARMIAGGLVPMMEAIR